MNKIELFAYRMKLRKQFRQAPKEFLNVMKEEIEREFDLRKKNK